MLTGIYLYTYINCQFISQRISLQNLRAIMDVYGNRNLWLPIMKRIGKPLHIITETGYFNLFCLNNMLNSICLNMKGRYKETP